MHRSGTSALSRALSFCGYAQPRDIMPPEPDNPNGSWAPRGVVALNTEILSTLGGNWQLPGPFLVAGLAPADSRTRVMSVVTARWRDAAVSALNRSYGDA